MAFAKWSDEALEDIGKLDSIIRERVLARISWLEKNFSDIVHGHLHYGLREMCKLRVGDYRVIYSINKDRITIELVRHRREVYK
jgi:mRNA-degrading endonuclease RelE of RelBE toxin-antitoxin system